MVIGHIYNILCDIMYICIIHTIKYINIGVYKTMKTYKDIKYCIEWLNGNWYIVMLELQKKIQMQEPFTNEDVTQIIEDEVRQFI